MCVEDLDYMHARYYSPWVGRFLSVDPKGGTTASKLPQRWNRYAYARNNPMKFLDPDGNEEVNSTVTPASTLSFIGDSLKKMIQPAIFGRAVTTGREALVQAGATAREAAVAVPDATVALTLGGDVVGGFGGAGLQGGLVVDTQLQVGAIASATAKFGGGALVMAGATVSVSEGSLQEQDGVKTQYVLAVGEGLGLAVSLDEQGRITAARGVLIGINKGVAATEDLVVATAVCIAGCTDDPEPE